ncbi:hypothetical protein FXO37_24262 [Capsicum annuum]|nr:hypothetical protein FXO37_24262 [Capsicum annuum]
MAEFLFGEMQNLVIGGKKALLAYHYMISKLCMDTGVLELLGIDEMFEAIRTFDFDLIKDAGNPFAKKARQVANILEGLLPQDVGISSTPPPVKSVPSQPQGILSSVILNSQALWTEVMEGGMKTWINAQLKCQYGKVQGRLDTFESRITRYLSGGKMPNVNDI